MCGRNGIGRLGSDIDGRSGQREAAVGCVGRVSGRRRRVKLV